jgi:endonuclease YncB( thermonuclease family)
MKLFIFYWLLMGNAFAIDSFTLSSEKTLYIVDGDSISMQMRIAGIDTPEITQPCEKISGTIIDCGRLAKNYLKRTLKQLPGKLLIEPVAIDHYHRVLVKVFKGDINIGKKMVEQGMAFSYKNTYRQEEDLAKSKKIGFWGFYQPPIKPYKYRKSNQYRRKN